MSATADSTVHASANACYLGFDFGNRYIGVAVGQGLTGTARPLETLAASGGAPDWRRIAALVAEWRPAALVVGLPLTLEGNEQSISTRARAFGAELAERHGRPVHYCDERLTSREAAARFAEQRHAGTKRRHHAANLDAMAAAIILESWLASHHD
jgi:putative Holliday junction resolvase